jgi:hypothetical protein
MDILLAGNGPSLWRVAYRRDVQRHYLWKSFRDQAEHYSGAGRKVFGFRPESCSPSARNRVRDQPGTLFGFTPESRSPSPGIRSEMLRFAPRLGLRAFSDVFWNQSLLVPHQLAATFPDQNTANNSNKTK